MKIAICYSGQMGAFIKAFPAQKKTFWKREYDIYCYTSDTVSQKGQTSSINIKPISKVYKYLPKGEGWRKNYNTYGIIYKINNSLAKAILENAFGEKLQAYVVEKCNIKESLKDTEMTKWEWMKKRQLSKLKKCNDLLKKTSKKYDIVIRSRFEFMPLKEIKIKEIVESFGGLQGIKNKIFVYGGFACTPPMVFMDEFFCDGFAFGTPETMDIFCSLADIEQPYLPNKKYIDTFNKWGDNIEHQFRTHMLKNNIEICYISDKRSDYHLAR